MRLKMMPVLVAVPLLLTACALGIQPLLDDYNSLFEVTLRDEQGSENKDWLFEHYEVSKLNTLNLYGPLNCSSYKWELVAEAGGKGKLPNDFDIDTYGGNTQHLRINLQAAKFEAGYFTLTCTVVFQGEIIVDSCKINVVDPSQKVGS